MFRMHSLNLIQFYLWINTNSWIWVTQSENSGHKKSCDVCYTRGHWQCRDMSTSRTCLSYNILSGHIKECLKASNQEVMCSDFLKYITVGKFQKWIMIINVSITIFLVCLQSASQVLWLSRHVRSQQCEVLSKAAWHSLHGNPYGTSGHLPLRTIFHSCSN